MWGPWFFPNSCFFDLAPCWAPFSILANIDRKQINQCLTVFSIPKDQHDSKDLTRMSTERCLVTGHIYSWTGPTGPGNWPMVDRLLHGCWYKVKSKKTIGWAARLLTSLFCGWRVADWTLTKAQPAKLCLDRSWKGWVNIFRKEIIARFNQQPVWQQKSTSSQICRISPGASRCIQVLWFTRGPKTGVVSRVPNWRAFSPFSDTRYSTRQENQQLGISQIQQKDSHFVQFGMHLCYMTPI